MTDEKPAVVIKKGSDRYYYPITTKQGRSRRKLVASKQLAMRLGSRIKLLSCALRKHVMFFDQGFIDNLDGLVQQLHELLRQNPWLRKNCPTLMIAETEGSHAVMLSFRPEAKRILKEIGIEIP